MLITTFPKCFCAHIYSYALFLVSYCFKKNRRKVERKQERGTYSFAVSIVKIFSSTTGLISELSIARFMSSNRSLLPTRIPRTVPGSHQPLPFPLLNKNKKKKEIGRGEKKTKTCTSSQEFPYSPDPP